MVEIGISVPQVNPETNIILYRKLHRAMQKDLILACHDLSDGGLLVALAESSFGGNERM